MSNETEFQSRLLKLLSEHGWQVTDLGKSRFSLVLDAQGVFLSFHLNAALLRERGEIPLHYEFLPLEETPAEGPVTREEPESQEQPASEPQIETETELEPENEFEELTPAEPTPVPQPILEQPEEAEPQLIMPPPPPAVKIPESEGVAEKTGTVSSEVIEIQTTLMALTLHCPPDSTKNEVRNDLRPRILIGRGLQCDLILKDPMASREHAVITKDDKNYWLQDLKSANGLFLNDKPVDRTKLKSGDWIRIGDIRIQVQIEISIR